MNHQPFPPFVPSAALPRDAVQVQAFATAGELNFSHLNAALGLSISTSYYRQLQKHFFYVEKKNPTLGELRLLGHLATRPPLAQLQSLEALTTNSAVIAETWADIMAGYAAVSDASEKPCTLADILALPGTYRKRAKASVSQDSGVRVVSSAGEPQAMADGYIPRMVLQSADGAPRCVWLSDGSFKLAKGFADVGDILVAIPETAQDVLSAFLSQHPVMRCVKDVAVVRNTSLLSAALTLCGDRGLSLNPCTMLGTAEVTQNPVDAYLAAWEAPLSRGRVQAVFCIPPFAQAPLFTALSEHGFFPRVMGQVIKQSRVVFSDGVLTTVNLEAGLVREAVDIRPYQAILADPAPWGALLSGSMVLTPPTALPEIGITVADVTLSVAGDEGFTAAVEAVLHLCFDLAAAGILYDEISLSPVLYVQGGAGSPLLLSAICGLYRACTELAIPMVHPEILFKQGEQPQQTSLKISLTAYAPSLPCEKSKGFVGADHPLTLLVPEEAPAWKDIRGLLFTVTKAVRSGELYALQPLHGESILTLLAQGHLSCGGIRAGLFESYRELLEAPIPIGFLAEGAVNSAGLHIGETQAMDECDPSPEAAAVAEQCPWVITPCEQIHLQQLKDKETQRRKEIAAMEAMKRFEPLSQKARTVLLDTDIGPDCDDVGALAVLIYYAKQYGFPIGGICNCTSNKAGNGVIDAVCRRCGIETPPLGQWHGTGFMDGVEHCKYNTAVAEAHSEAYRNGTLMVEDEVTFYRKRLSEAKDGDVMIISIGMFNNLAALLDSPADDISPLTGMELVKSKVYALVSMAAILPQGRECNVISDYPSAEKVFKDWPTAIYLSDFHIGVNVKTGYGHITDLSAIMADPLPMSYHLYTKEWNWEGAIKGQNASYDLTAVQFAALGVGELYGLDTPGDLEFYAEIPELPDATRFVPDPMGNKIFMTKKVPDEAIAESLQKILEAF